MSAVATSPIETGSGPDACGHCGFVRHEQPTKLSRTLARTAVGYERAALAVLSAGRPGDEIARSVLDQVVHVRDTSMATSTVWAAWPSTTTRYSAIRIRGLFS